MNDDKDPLNTASHPDVADPDAGDPWDDDDGGGRTIAAAPSFEIPSDVPSPITAPPPAFVPSAPKPMASPAGVKSAAGVKMPPAGVKMPPMRKPQATMMGFGPPGPALPSERPGVNVPNAPRPLTGQLPTTPAFPVQRAPVPSGSALGGAARRSSPDHAAAAAAPSRLSAATRAPPLAPRPLGPAPVLPRPAAASPSVAPPAAAPALAAPPSARGAPLAAPPSAHGVAPVVAPAAPPSAPAADAADDDPWSSDSQQDDGPTRAVAAPVLSSQGSAPLRDDSPDPNPLFATMASADYPPRARSGADTNAETVALSGDDLRLPSMVSDDSGELEDMTRALSRDQMVREQDAHIVVGDDAEGDEATMAFAPGQLTGLAPPSGSAAVESYRGQLPSQPDPRPAFPSSPQHFGPQEPWSADDTQDARSQSQPPQPLGMGMDPVVPSWGAAPAPSYANPPQGGAPPGGGPMLPQHGPSPSSPEHGAAQFGQAGQQPYGQPMNMGMQPGPGPYGPHADAPMQQMQQMQQMQMGHPPAMQPMQQSMQQPMQPMHGNPQGWMGPQGGPTQPSQRSQPPQLILLVAVGAVCLTIFVIGVVLFVTTRF